MNDDCQSPLDVARAKGHSNVVRTIEVCLPRNSILTPTRSFFWVETVVSR